MLRTTIGRIVASLVMVTSVIVVAEQPTRAAEEYPYSHTSADGGATASWDLDPYSGRTTGTLTDLSAIDGVCARAWFVGYDAQLNQSLGDGSVTTCTTTTFDYYATYSDSLKVTVCGSVCSYEQPDPGCTWGFPWLLANIPETEDELRYVDYLTACTDMAQNATRVENKSPVVWSVIGLDGSVPQVTPLRQPLSDKVFRALDLGGLGRQLLLPGSTAIVLASFDKVRYSIEYRQTAAWLPIDHVADKWADYAVDATALLNTKSKGFNAMLACGAAVYSSRKAINAVIKGTDIKDILLGTAGAGSAAITCSTKLRTALDLTPWKTQLTLNTIGSALGKSAWVGYADDALKLAKQLRAVFPR